MYHEALFVPPNWSTGKYGYIPYYLLHTYNRLCTADVAYPTD
jgi:hypothetical protein